jgi:hypothetical protein
MALWKIEPTWKKSLAERSHYTKDDKEIIIETGWRWGEFTIETEDDTPPVLEEGVDLFNCDYEVEMQYCDDGCWEDREFYGMSEEEIAEMEEWLDENSWLDLEEEGWIPSDNEMIMSCEPSIELITE